MIFVRLDPNPPAPAPATLMGLGAGTGLAVGGNTAVQRLQQSLAQLAIAVNRPAINPGPADGLVNQQVMMAIVQAFNILAEKLPTEAKYALQIALLAGSLSSQAMNLVKAYADILNVAAQAAIMRYSQTPNAPVPTPPGPTSPQTPIVPYVPYTPPPPRQPVQATPWYKTTGGMVGIGTSAAAAVLLLALALK